MIDMSVSCNWVSPHVIHVSRGHFLMILFKGNLAENTSGNKIYRISLKLHILNKGFRLENDFLFRAILLGHRNGNQI